jgi:hypothetical protein
MIIKTFRIFYGSPKRERKGKTEKWGEKSERKKEKRDRQKGLRERKKRNKGDKEETAR